MRFRNDLALIIYPLIRILHLISLGKENSKFILFYRLITGDKHQNIQLSLLISLWRYIFALPGLIGPIGPMLYHSYFERDLAQFNIVSYYRKLKLYGLISMPPRKFQLISIFFCQIIFSKSELSVNLS